ncbi:MAG: SDR family oxidoreductase [Deltaproteobacteria bacterium]|nr:SDR family oxidoreductase [Deltaproteobacteria bacterium]
MSEKIAIVTGGSKGLGRAMAVGLADAGATVVVISRTKSLIEDTANEIIDRGHCALAIPADVKKPEDIENAVKIILEKFGRVDVLINNAGIAPMNRTTDISIKEWDDVLDTNVKSYFLSAKAVGPHMIRQGEGKIINISSALGKMASNMAVHYCTSKAGVIQMTRALALEWARFNINVNCIAPGFFNTDMTAMQQQDEAHSRFLQAKIPFKRLGQPEEIVGTAIFLASSASRYITGETIVVDGGYSIW